MIHSTTEHALLNDALDRITALERALKRLRTRIAAQEKRPAQIRVVEYRKRDFGDLSS